MKNDELKLELCEARAERDYYRRRAEAGEKLRDFLNSEEERCGPCIPSCTGCKALKVYEEEIRDRIEKGV